MSEYNTETDLDRSPSPARQQTGEQEGQDESTDHDELFAQLDGSTYKPRPLDRTFTFDDFGLGQRFAYRWGDLTRFNHATESWLCFDGKRWATDVSGEVDRRAVDTVEAILDDELGGLIDPTKKELSRHEVFYLGARSQKAVSKMLKRARSRVAVTPQQLDRDPMLLNVDNGTLDLRKGELHDHSPDDELTKLAPVPYDPNAPAPTWEGFLSDIFNGDEELIEYVQRAVGYSITGKVSEHVLFVAHGDGANGKSTFIETLHAALGDYSQAAPSDLMLDLGRHGGPSPEKARLKGSRFVTTSETEQGLRFAESEVKQLTGGDRIVARDLYESYYEFDPTHTLWLVTNHRPQVKGQDRGIWRRLKLVPFSVTISRHEQDPELPERLRGELPGVLRWAVEGCRAWQEQGLGDEPEAVQAATERYREEMDPVGRFLDEACKLGDEDEYRTQASDMHAAYTSWAKAVGDVELLSKRKLGMELKQRHGIKKKKASVWYYLGVRPLLRWEVGA